MASTPSHACAGCHAFHQGECVEMTQEEFDRITDKVLHYRPKPKTKAEKRRIRRKKREARKLAGLTPVSA